MNNLFEKYPVINYGGSISVNILAKVNITNSVLGDTTIYYPYTIKDGETPYQIAQNYYGDPRYVWLVFMSNKIVDPYFEWPLDNPTFEQHVIKKYGSLEKAIEKTAFYRVSYKDDDRMLNQSMYEAQPGYLKRYWKPVVNEAGTTLFYNRKDDELVVETNQIVELYVTNPQNFTNGENVLQSNTSGGLLGKGQIKSLESNRIIVQHIEGVFANTAGSVANVQGQESRATSALTNPTVLYTTLSAQEFVYWEPVSYYTYEDEVNTSRKFIRLIDSAYVDRIEKEMQELL